MLPMSVKLATVAMTSLAVVACSSNTVLSQRNTWGSDFTDRSPPTSNCSGGTLSQLRTRMEVSNPLTPSEAKEHAPNSVISKISGDDRFHTFQFSTDLNLGNPWGFTGYLLSRGDCIVLAKVTSYDN